MAAILFVGAEFAPIQRGFFSLALPRPCLLSTHIVENTSETKSSVPVFNLMTNSTCHVSSPYQENEPEKPTMENTSETTSSVPIFMIITNWICHVGFFAIPA